MRSLLQDAETAAMRAQISLLQAALQEANIELQTARKAEDPMSQVFVFASTAFDARTRMHVLEYVCAHVC
jgi:hypothetical protein